jgi:hypothetical protein
MIDFQSLRASLASVSITPPRDTTKGLNVRSEGGCRRRFSLATALRCFSTSLALLSSVESPSVATRGSVAVWESCEASETMVMSMSSLESPLAADPVILMSFLRCVPLIRGSRWIRTPSTVARAVPITLTPEQAKAMVEASSKLGKVWLTTIPFQPSLRLTDFEVAAALQLRTLTGEREANFFGHPRGLPPEEVQEGSPT